MDLPRNSSSVHAPVVLVKRSPWPLQPARPNAVHCGDQRTAGWLSFTRIRPGRCHQLLPASFDIQSQSYELISSVWSFGKSGEISIERLAPSGRPPLALVQLAPPLTERQMPSLSSDTNSV